MANKGDRRKNCPCCNADLDADTSRRRNFRRWRTACIVFVAVGWLMFVARLLFFKHDVALLLASLSIIATVSVLYNLSAIWLPEADSATKPPSPTD